MTLSTTTMTAVTTAPSISTSADAVLPEVLLLPRIVTLVAFIFIATLLALKSRLVTAMFYYHCTCTSTKFMVLASVTDRCCLVDILLSPKPASLHHSHRHYHFLLPLLHILLPLPLLPLSVPLPIIYHHFTITRYYCCCYNCHHHYHHPFIINVI